MAPIPTAAGQPVTSEPGPPARWCAEAEASATRPSAFIGIGCGATVPPSAWPSLLTSCAVFAWAAGLHHGTPARVLVLYGTTVGVGLGVLDGLAEFPWWDGP